MNPRARIGDDISNIYNHVTLGNKRNMASKFLLIKPNQAACKLCFFPRTADLNFNQAFV